jgi:hypothetical protein
MMLPGIRLGSLLCTACLLPSTTCTKGKKTIEIHNPMAPQCPSSAFGAGDTTRATIAFLFEYTKR